MRKLILLLLLIASPAWAGGVISGAVLSGCSTGGGATCSTSTDYVGQKNAGYSTAASNSHDYIICQKYTASCSSCASGTLSNLYFNHHATSSESAAMCVYGPTSNSSPSGEAKVGCGTGKITSSTDNEDATVAADGGSITCGSSYWLCISPATGGYYSHKTTGLSVWWIACTGCDDAMPATLSTGTWTESTDYKMQIWATIGP